MSFWKADSIYFDYGYDTTESYAEDNAMIDDNLSDYSAEMGHDRDDF